MVGRRRKGPVYRNKPKKKVPKAFGRAITAGSVLFLIAMVIGLVYTLVSEQHATPPPAPQQITTVSTGAIKPRPVTEYKTVGVAVDSFTSLAYIGGTASISVRTAPQANCKIEVVYNGVDAIDPGLAPQKADDYGSVTWTWIVAPSTPVGLWPVNVTCANSHDWGVVQTKLAISSS